MSASRNVAATCNATRNVGHNKNQRALEKEKEREINGVYYHKILSAALSDGDSRTSARERASYGGNLTV